MSDVKAAGILPKVATLQNYYTRIHLKKSCHPITVHIEGVI